MFAVIAVAVFGVEVASAQQFKWSLGLDTRFDNHEYEAVKAPGLISSGTAFSTRATPVVGIGFGAGHSVMGGGSFIFDMGAPLDKRDPELLLYYNYKSPKFGVYAGKFERRRLVGSYSRAIYSGSRAFYDNVLEGFAVQYTPRQGSFEIVLDWDGIQSEAVRESFRVLSAAEWSPTEARSMRWFTAGYSFDGYHLASSAEALEGVVDHVLINPFVGVDFRRLGAEWFQKLRLTAGWLGSFDRERRGDGEWKPTHGVTLDFVVQKWNVGIDNRLYVGNALFPFWSDYGRSVYKGEAFYAVSDVYNFTKLYWKPRLAEGVALDLQMIFHYDGRHFGFQQVVQVGVSLDSGMFGRKHKKHRY
jgi:hypothetical protein